MDTYLWYYQLSRFLEAVLPIATIILSVIILAKKDKKAKLLAIYCILISCCGLFSSFVDRMSRVSVQGYATASAVNSILGVLVSATALIAICVYAKNEYGSKMYIAVPSLYVGAQIIGRIANAMAVTFAKGAGESEMIKKICIAHAVSLVINFIPSVILIGEFYINREKELRFPMLWKLLGLVTVFAFLHNFFALLALFGQSENGASEIVILLQDVSALTVVLCWFMIALYVLMRSKAGTDEATT